MASKTAHTVATAGLSADDDRIRRNRRARGRQEEAHEADVQRAANLRPRENVRADEIPSGAGTRQIGLRPRHVGVAGQGMVPEQADKMAEKARGRDGDGEEAARRGRRRRRGG